MDLHETCSSSNVSETQHLSLFGREYGAKILGTRASLGRRWVQWRWLGKDGKSDDSIVYVDNRVRTYRTVKRFPDVQRWDARVAVQLEGRSSY